ncbi:autophagy-related protein 18f-like isoform X1 [Fagus crenata]
MKVNWAGFDKLEGEGDVIRQVLLLGYWSGFQVWDVEDANNVRDLVSRHDGPVSFMQMLPKPIASKRLQDKFAESHPLLVVCADGSISVGSNIQNGLATPCNGSIPNCHDPVNGSFLPTAVRSRVVAISQAARLRRVLALEAYGYGPLAVGPRWLAYSGSPVVVSNSGRVSPQHLMPSASFPGFPSNGSLVAHYAEESSKQLAAGIKKLSRYCSELLPDGNTSVQSGCPGWKGNGTVDGHLTDAENIGMVIVRDIVSKVVIAQFRAHRSPISALCFDLSGTLLVTASVQGHNINVFKIMPGQSVSSSASAYVHLYRLQSGFTNAESIVIQDISFSDDSSWIMISSSRGTSHLFAINPLGGSVNFQSADAGCTIKNSSLGATTKPAVRRPPSQQSLCAAGPPVTLSVVSRIRNGTNGWKGTVSGAAAAATGRMSSLPGAIASSFHNCRGNALFLDCSSSKAKYHLLVFSPSGCMVLLEIITYNPTLERVGASNRYKSHGQSSSLKASFEIELGPLDFNMIYFQSMMEGTKINEENAGEIEIERIPTRMIEARSKGLVPVVDYLQTSKIQQTRFTNDSPKTKSRVEIVNNRESLRMEAQLKFVNSNKEGLKMENHFEDEGGEFD